MIDWPALAAVALGILGVVAGYVLVLGIALIALEVDE